MFEHQIRYPFCRVSFWKDGVAASKSDPWTQCIVSPHGHSYAGQSFDNTPNDLHRRDALLSFLEKAYDLGKDAAKKEIRGVLGVKESRI